MEQATNVSCSDREIEYATRIVEQVCNLAGPLDYITRCRAEMQRHGLSARNSPSVADLYDWLIDIVSYQGISDQAAAGFIREHGQANSLRRISGLSGISPALF